MQDSSVYETLKKIRESKTVKLKPNKYMNPAINLRYYQTIGVANLYMIKKMVLGDATGTGKTGTAATTYAALLNDDPNQKLMVICPSSALYQWQSEINKFCVDITSQIVESETIKVGRTALSSFDSREYQFKQFENNNKHVLIFNYNTLKTDFHILYELTRKYKFMVIFDEATAFKNHKSQTFEYAKKLVASVDRAYALTATIIKNNLMEAFSIYKVLLPTLFGSIEHFQNRYCIIEKKKLWKGRGNFNRFIKVIKGYKNLDEFKQIIYPFFLGRRTTDISNELPEISSREIIINMDKEQEELYQDVLHGFLDYNKFKIQTFNIFLDNEDAESTEELKETKFIDKLTALIYCQQLSNSPKILGFEASSSKEKELLRLLTEELAGEKIVIYTRFKKMINRLEDLINKLDLKCTKITGDVKSRDREVNKQLFNESSDCNIILINAAGSEAINLQSSGHLVFYDLPFSYGDFLQIIGRIRRIGSTHKNIMLHYLINKNTVDEKVMKILSSKKILFDEVLGDSATGALTIKADTDSTILQIYDEIVSEIKNSKDITGLGLDQ